MSCIATVGKDDVSGPAPPGVTREQPSGLRTLFPVSPPFFLSPELPPVSSPRHSFPSLLPPGRHRSSTWCISASPAHLQILLPPPPCSLSDGCQTFLPSLLSLIITIRAVALGKPQGWEMPEGHCPVAPAPERATGVLPLLLVGCRGSELEAGSELHMNPLSQIIAVRPVWLFNGRRVTRRCSISQKPGSK